ncbi:unnamed protein product [Colias eurytheme]|nr:unnamed protein product [Colias eurytheme]
MHAKLKERFRQGMMISDRENELGSRRTRGELCACFREKLDIKLRARTQPGAERLQRAIAAAVHSTRFARPSTSPYGVFIGRLSVFYTVHIYTRREPSARRPPPKIPSHPGDGMSLSRA